MAPKLPPKPIREQARVKYSYTAQNDDELSMKKGEIITIICKDNEDIGWWKGELNGRIALFPDNFVEIIKQPSQPSLAIPSTTTLGSSTSSEIKKIKKPDRSNNSENSADSISSTSTEPSSLTSVVHGSSNKSKNTKPVTLVKDISKDQVKDIVKDQIKDIAKDQVKDDNATLLSPSNDDSLNDSTDEALSLGNNSKLEHLTKNRPKIPSNSRRPPSLYFPKDFEIISIPSEINLNGNGNSVEPGSPQSVESTDSTNEGRLLPNKTISSPTQEKIPWMLELKQAQDKKREQRKELTFPNEVKYNSIPLPVCPTQQKLSTSTNSPLNKPFVSKSSKPCLITHLDSGNVTNEHSSSGSDNNSQLKISSAPISTSSVSNNAIATGLKLSSATSTLSGHDKLPPTSPTTNAYSLTKQEINAELQDLHGKLKELDDKFQSYVRQQNTAMDKMVSFKLYYYYYWF